MASVSICRLYENLWLAAAYRGALLVAALSLLGGCGTLGNATIVGTRTPVNEAVATTARQQTLMNIVRVYHNESPVILDVTETDEVVGVSGQAMGGVAGIGSPVGGSLAGLVGSAGGTVSASDNLTNRYIPLQGQALISQLSSPITVETLTALYDSRWPLQSILEFAVDRLSPVKDNYRLAQGYLTLLDANNSISLATAKSAFSKGKENEDNHLNKSTNINLYNSPAPTGGGDTLNVYLRPRRSKTEEMADFPDEQSIWNSLYALYHETQPRPDGSVESNRDPPSRMLELRNSPRTNIGKMSISEFRDTYLGPVLRTRTAIGILKYIVQQPKVAFIDIDGYKKISELPWNSRSYFKRCPEADSYILDPRDTQDLQWGDPEISFDQSKSSQNPNILEKYLNTFNDTSTQHNSQNCIYSVSSNFKKKLGQDILDKDVHLLTVETEVSSLRRYILVVRAQSLPELFYTAWFDGSNYFYIEKNDFISQRNLMLISQLLTIQATSTPTPSLTTIMPSGR